MRIVDRKGKWRLLDRQATLLLMDERTLDRIVEDPAMPLLPEEDKGFSGEKHRIYDAKTSLIDVCREGQEKEARRMEVSYDFFFGGSKRTNYPDSPATLRAYKVIHDTAARYGMRFSASVVSPLDVGAGYSKTHGNAGRVMQFKECAVDSDGRFETRMTLQTQWTNNKGPIALELLEVRAYAFNESRLGDTPFYYVDENEILDVSGGVTYTADPASITVSASGYGRGILSVRGKASGCGRNRCLAVAVYGTPELDYFDAGAGKYMKSVIDLHNREGIRYAGFYSDEMHIQFDWDLGSHFGHDSEINVRYATESLAAEYAARYGRQYRDFGKYLVYFAYHQHDFLGGWEGALPSQHVMGPDRAGVLRTWRFRKRYFEMLGRRVADLCLKTKDYAESLFGGPIMTRAHATWQESPTCDRFFDTQRFSEASERHFSRYDYTPEYEWSSSIRENIAACYDYFKWNEYLTGGGTDHPEGGFLDRNYYGSAFAASLALLNRFPFSYYGFWGGPAPIMDRLADVGVTYGNQAGEERLDHNFVQGLTPRLCDVLALYPLDLNYTEERFGSWMVQYGYADYITDEQLVRHFSGVDGGKMRVGGRRYGTLLALYSPYLSEKALSLLEAFAGGGGRVVWCSAPVQDPEDALAARWRKLFGVEAFDFPVGGAAAAGSPVDFGGALAGIAPMEVPTDMLPDFTYPVRPAPQAAVVAHIGGRPVGTLRLDPSGGQAVYLGVRLRDDQSCSQGRDMSTLYDVLTRLGAYAPGGCEALSRPAGSRYVVNRFPNGAVSVANHMRTIGENWYGSFFRDEEEDQKIVARTALTPDEIELTDAPMPERRITYRGRGAMTYRLDAEGRLDGFAGRQTTGIGVDGTDYRFTEKPADIAWLRIAEEDLSPGVQKAYAVRCSEPGVLTLPVDGSRLRGALCGKDFHETRGPVGLTVSDGKTMLEVGPGLQNQWLVLYEVQ